MSYTVNNFNGNFLTTVADGTIDTTTDVRFVGKNYAGYGEIQNENFLHLMENFANTTPPPKPVLGQIWYDATSTEKKLKFWNGANWKIAGGAKVQNVAPTGLATGEFWWDPSTKQLYVWSETDAEYILIGPDTPGDLGASGTVSRVVKDTLNNPHTIVEIKSSGKTVAIISEDSEFFLSNENLIPGFYNTENTLSVKKGITIADALKNPSTGGWASSAYKFWGTVTNADQLGGVPAADFISLLEGDFSQNIKFGDGGFILGNRDNFRIKVENTDELIIENSLGEEITLRIGSNPSSNVIVVNTTGIIPSDTNIFSLGNVNAKWKDIFVTDVKATNITGTLTGNSTGVHKGNVISGSDGIIVNSATNEVGNPDGSTEFRGIFLGSFGSLDEPATVFGTATNANTLAGILPSEQVPSSGTKVTVAVRDTNGDIHARNFVASGSVNKASTLAFDSGFYSASSIIPGGVDKRSIVARDTAGDIYATLFRGTATAARYADLAEKYLADKDYEVGTVLAVGGEKEVTASQSGDRAIGVVSANPAYMMNSELEGGTYVALKGRVPVKVRGEIKKKDRLVASNDGYAVKAESHQYADVFAIALEDGVELIEAVIL